MCPACNEPLVSFELEGVEIDHCISCGGTWLDGGEMEQIAELAGAEPGKLSDALVRGGGGKHGKRVCLRCPSKLRVVSVEKIEIDRCPYGHGLWFDRGELKAVIASFEGGEEGAVARFFGEFFRSEMGPQEEGG